MSYFPFMSINKVVPSFCVLREIYYVIIWQIVRICVFIKDWKLIYSELFILKRKSIENSGGSWHKLQHAFPDITHVIFLFCTSARLIGSYTSPYWRSGISSTSVRNSVFSRVERCWISLTSGRNPRSSIRTSASTCFFRFNLKTKHVNFIHSFACQCHVYYTKYYNATCNAVNTLI